MDNGFLKVQHTNGNVEIFKLDNSATPGPSQKDHQGHIDTDVELDSDVGQQYKTPVRLQKKKRTILPVIEPSESLAEDEDTEVEQKKQKVIEKKQKVIEKKRNKGQRPVPTPVIDNKFLLL
jgi:hypothetical protein